MTVVEGDHGTDERETNVTRQTAAADGDDAELRAHVRQMRAERAAREETDPAPVKDTLAGLVARLPEPARAAFAAANAPEALAQRAAQQRADAAEAIAEMRATQERARNAAWQRCRPSRYAGAWLGALRPQQDPGGAVSGWLGSGSQNLLLAGPSRHGKTTAAFAVGQQARDAGAWVLAWNAAALIDAVRPGAEDQGRAWHHALECELLIVDDLGRDRQTDWSRERLYLLFETRLSNGRRTIVTTNESYDALTSRYGDPIVERIIESAAIVKVQGVPLTPEDTPW